ncbi:MAG: hypothetical protein HKL90_14240, partial [Elusimicrobia bacterium]|nr:hypothetical protein [Elusimicrobiota bacterium]
MAASLRQTQAFKASRTIEDIYELTYIRKDASRFPAVVSVTALRDAQNAIIGYLLIGTDNTARKQVEAELLNARVTMQRELVANVSHELSTPISVILGSIETLMGEVGNAKTRRNFLKIIENHAKRLAGLVKNLLLVAELASGATKPVPSLIPLAVGAPDQSGHHSGAKRPPFRSKAATVPDKAATLV